VYGKITGEYGIKKRLKFFFLFSLRQRFEGFGGCLGDGWGFHLMLPGLFAVGWMMFGRGFCCGEPWGLGGSFALPGWRIYGRIFIGKTGQFLCG
jgi:hypothetical protein